MPIITPQQDLNLQRWIAALRTTTIPQTRGKLFRNKEIARIDFNHIPAGACCLGIACEAFQVPYEIINGQYRQYSFETLDATYDHTDELPIAVLQETFGLAHKDQQMLMSLNDDKKWTFAQIADWLEQFRLANLDQGPFPTNPLHDPE